MQWTSERAFKVAPLIALPSTVLIAPGRFIRCPIKVGVWSNHPNAVRLDLTGHLLHEDPVRHKGLQDCDRLFFAQTSVSAQGFLVIKVKREKYPSGAILEALLDEKVSEILASFTSEFVKFTARNEAHAVAVSTQAHYHQAIFRLEPQLIWNQCEEFLRVGNSNFICHVLTLPDAIAAAQQVRHFCG